MSQRTTRVMSGRLLFIAGANAARSSLFTGPSVRRALRLLNPVLGREHRRAVSNQQGTIVHPVALTRLIVERERELKSAFVRAPCGMSPTRWKRET